MGKRKLKTVFWVFLLLIVTGLIGCKQKEPEKEQLCHIVMEKGDGYQVTDPVRTIKSGSNVSFTVTLDNNWQLLGTDYHGETEIIKDDDGKIGNVLWAFANGWDEDPVCKEGYEAPVKSIGNSTTTPRDLENDLDVWIIQIALAESVAARLRKHGFKCKTVEITVRDNGLYSFSRQIHLRQPTNITNEIVTAAFQLFKDNYKWEHPIRSLGIRAADLVLDDIPVQLDLFGNQEKKEKLEKLDRTVDEIRRRFGYFSIQRAAMYQDKVLSHLDAGTHTIHPHSYFHR